MGKTSTCRPSYTTLIVLTLVTNQFQFLFGFMVLCKMLWTYSLFFSLMLAPLRSNSSVTCFLLGWGEATAQC